LLLEAKKAMNAANRSADAMAAAVKAALVLGNEVGSATLIPIAIAAPAASASAATNGTAHCTVVSAKGKVCMNRCVAGNTVAIWKMHCDQQQARETRAAARQAEN